MFILVVERCTADVEVASIEPNIYFALYLDSRMLNSPVCSHILRNI